MRQCIVHSVRFCFHLCVCSGLKVSPGSAIFRCEDHGNTAEKIFKFSCWQEDVVFLPSVFYRLSRCRGCYGYVTALVYRQLWDNAGSSVLQWYTTSTVPYRLKLEFTLIPPPKEVLQQISSRADVFLCSIRQTGIGQCCSEALLPFSFPSARLLTLS